MNDIADPASWAEHLRIDGQPDRAEMVAREALRRFPDRAATHNALGMAQHDLNRLEEAANSFRGALYHDPSFASAWINLGLVRHKQGALADAEACHRTALRLGADPAMVGANLGLALLEQGRPEEAEPACRAALGGPVDAAARINLAMALLQMGRLAEGWAAYEARYDPARLPAPPLTSLAQAVGRTVLVQAEQGFGDTLQFCRYVPLLVDAGARVVLRVPAALRRLLSVLPATVIGDDDIIPPVDLACWLMSLPHVFGTTLETIPSHVPYLSVSASAIAVWRDRLSGLPGRRVGLVWGGGVRPDNAHLCSIDRRRSVPLAALAPLAGLAGCSFVSLQIGPPAEQMGAQDVLPLHDVSMWLRDFADTAALIGALDLVIAVDTAVAHLAAAMGRPVWLLNRFDSCWRWLRGRDDSPWYPTLRQFRQAEPGDWTGVVARIAKALAHPGD